MESYNTVYKHSGKIGPALFIVPIASIIGATLLSLAYAYISVYSPIAGYISILFVAGFAFGTGMVVSFAGKLGKCRNTGFLHLAGFLTGLYAIYISWAIFTFALLKKSGIDADLVHILSSPDALWTFVTTLNANGWYSIKSWTPTGTVLWIFWGIEALMIAGISSILGANGIDSEIFCEKCSKWCSPSLFDFHMGLTSETAMLDALKNGDIDTLATLDRVESSVFPRFDVKILNCDTCKETAGFKLCFSSIETDKEGKTEEKSEDFSELFVLNYSSFEKLKAIGEKLVKKEDTAN